MHVRFIQNSEELPQENFVANLTSFREDRLTIKLDFSDPILVSQGLQADQVSIRLLRSYFMTVGW